MMDEQLVLVEIFTFSGKILKIVMDKADSIIFKHSLESIYRQALDTKIPYEATVRKQKSKKF